MSKIKEISISEELKSSYLDYAISVIISRALPDVRDGLKPVQRRILWTMKELGLWTREKFTKCANICGNVIARYHPHGDQAVYDTLVRLAQDFSLRYPLVLGQGNFGSIDGDPPAAYRYTEAKLSRIAEEMLADIEKETVDFRPNYDNTRQEPVVLATKVPNLLINGSLGIAVGMATNIPPHNLNEIVKALIFVLENPQASIREIMKFVPGPDFPTGAQIFDVENIIQVYEKGRGSILMRGIAELKEKEIIIKEIPYGVNKAELVKKIAELAVNKVINGIKDIRDESDREGIRIVIELKEGISSKSILNMLYKFTELEKNFNVNFIALEKGIQPRLFNFKELLVSFLDHRREVIIRRSKFELKRTEERIHILEGFKIAIENIDEVIKIIKSSQDAQEAQIKLERKFKLSSLQAKAVLEMSLRNLVKLEKQKILDEIEEKKKFAKQLKEILENPKKVDQVIKEELIEISKKYGDERRTKIVFSGPQKLKEEELIPDEEAFIVLNENFYIKRFPIFSLKTQKKGTKGINVSSENILFFSVANLRDKILILTENGKIYPLSVYSIPEFSKQAQGKIINSLVDLQKDEKIVKLLPLSWKEEFKWIVFVTKNGYVKKTNFEEFKKLRSDGIKAIKIQKEDSLVDAFFLKQDTDILLFSFDGYAIRFSTKELKEQTRLGGGVLGMRNKTKIIGATKLDEQTEDIFLISEYGYGKIIKAKSIKKQKRGGKGLKVFKINQKTGPLKNALSLKGQEIIIVSSKGQALKIGRNNIKVLSRISMGSKLIKLQPGDSVSIVTEI